MSQSVVWTKHVLHRLSERQLTKERVQKALMDPDRRHPGKQPGTTEYVRKDAGQYVTAVASKNNRGQLVVVSAWVDPPFPGTKDARHKRYYERYKKAGFWGKIWYLALRQMGWW